MNKIPEKVKKKQRGTATFFFQGDDVAAWMNFLRAVGC